MKKIIDLHVHTNMSDGKFSPKEIIDIAKKNNVSVISICDHDTVLAYDDELFEYAKLNNIVVIPGVEVSARLNNIGIHVLGYNFDVNNQELRDKLCLLRNARNDYLYKVSDKLMNLGYVVNLEELVKNEIVTKAHIALDVINNSDNNDKLVQVFGHVPTKGEFIETIMNEGCPAYVEKMSITPKEVASLIKKAGGKVVLAHPVAYTREDNLTIEDILNIVNDMKPDGIEANYIYVDRNKNKINEISKWREFAGDNNLIATIGSDFHDDDVIYPDVGLINENLEFDDFYTDNIINSLLK